MEKVINKIKTFVSKHLTWLNEDIADLAMYLSMLNSRVTNVNGYVEKVDKRVKTLENKGKKKVAKKKKK